MKGLTKTLSLIMTLCMVMLSFGVLALAEGDENIVLDKPVKIGWSSEYSLYSGGIYAEVNERISSTNWRYYGVNFDFKLYKGGTSEENLVETADFYDASSYNFATAISENGEGDYYFRVRGVEYEYNTFDKTGNVSDWSEPSVLFNYKKHTENTISTLTLDIDRFKDCDTSGGGKFFDTDKEKGYDMSISARPFYTSVSDLFFSGYPYEAEISILIPYGTGVFGDKVTATVNGKKAVVKRLNDIRAVVYFEFPLIQSEPYLLLGDNDVSVDLFKKLGQTVNVGGGTAKLSEDTSSGKYTLELNGVSLSGAKSDWVLSDLDTDDDGNYINAVRSRSFGMRTNRDITLVLKSYNYIGSSEKSLFYGLSMDEASTLTITGDGSLDIYAGSDEDNSYGSTGYGYGIITGTGFCGLNIDSGWVRVIAREHATGIVTADFRQNGGVLAVSGGEENAAIKTSPFGSVTITGGQTVAESLQRPENSGAIETLGSPITITGGELIVLTKNENGSNGKAIYGESYLAYTNHISDFNFYGGKVTLIGEGGALVANYDPSTLSDATIKISSTIKGSDEIDVSGNIPNLCDSDSVKMLTMDAITKKLLDKIELENVKLSYEPGKKPSFKGNDSVPEKYRDVYTLTDESFSGSDGTSFSNNDDSELIAKFLQDVTYSYSANITISSSAYETGWRLAPAELLSLSINGKDVSVPRRNVKCSSISEASFTDVFSFTAGEEGPEPPVTVKYGDVSGDGFVKADDALLALQASVGKITLTQKQTLAADVDNNSNITATDALLILQYSVGKLTVFPVENK